MKKTILLIDDESDIIMVTTVRLENAGYQVLTAKDGEDGLSMAKKAKPDLILLDLLLPKMRGEEVCKILKSDPEFKQIPIILFTASQAGKVEDVAKNTGADSYILKPFESDTLMAKIKEFLPV
ncbi:MAG: response regulator [bacterium]